MVWSDCIQSLYISSFHVWPNKSRCGMCLHSFKMSESIVLYPSPGMGHLVSMMELGKLILHHYPTFSIHVLTFNPPFHTGATAPYMSRIAAEYPAISFHELSLPPNQCATFMDWFLVLKPLVREALESFSRRTPVRAFIMDFFCTSVLEDAEELCIPAYFFFTSAAAFLVLFLYFPELHKQNPGTLKDLDRDLFIPGLPPMPLSVFPDSMQDRSQKLYQWCLHHASRLPRGRGIIINSFHDLEPLGMRALAFEECAPGVPMPLTYCVGPLIAAGDSRNPSESLSWLDTQPAGTVVFLCFGSMGRLSAAQLNEIAVALERSEHRFLWVVRSPPAEGEEMGKRPPEPDLEALLPEGFLKRTAGKGLVVKTWAPQVAVLNHMAVGGFVTHCGWNSLLESVCAGVPMAAWPLYAEQHVNAWLMVGEREMGVAVGAVERGEDGVVGAEAVARLVRELMDSSRSMRVRERVAKLKERAAAALAEGGTSVTSLAELVNAWAEGPPPPPR
ncbi:hypothetical protein AMTRI_Chr01g109450 [Amborella trichopoda]